MWNKIKRWIKGFKNRQEQRDRVAAAGIGNYYLSLYMDNDSKDPYNEAIDDIVQLGITKVKWIGNKISITTTRPGLLIGRRGENLDKLGVFLSKELCCNVHLDLIEDIITSWLIPYDPKKYA